MLLSLCTARRFTFDFVALCLVCYRKLSRCVVYARDCFWGTVGKETQGFLFSQWVWKRSDGCVLYEYFFGFCFFFFVYFVFCFWQANCCFTITICCFCNWYAVTWTLINAKVISLLFQFWYNTTHWFLNLYCWLKLNLFDKVCAKI